MGWNLSLLCFAIWNRENFSSLEVHTRNCIFPALNGPDGGDKSGPSCYSEEVISRKTERTPCLPCPLAADPMANVCTLEVTEWFQVSENGGREQPLSNQNISDPVPALKPVPSAPCGSGLAYMYVAYIYTKLEILVCQSLQVRSHRLKYLGTGSRKALGRQQ